MVGKLITFDGVSGSGKTTHAQRIADILQMKYVSFFETFRLIVGVREMLTGEDSYGSWYTALQHLALFRGMIDGDTEWSRHQNGVVMDDGMFHVLPWFEETSNIDKMHAHQRMCIDAFRTGLTIHGGKEPDISFYLHTDRTVSTQRVFDRINSNMKTAIKLRSDADSAWLDTREKRVWEFRAAEIPYLHIIDASEPVDQVTEEILWIIESEGVRQ